MTKRVVIYARVSTNEQNCDRQVAELEQVVKNNNWELVRHLHRQRLFKDDYNQTRVR